MLAMSSFDLLVHDVIKIGVEFRVSNSRPLRNIRISSNCIDEDGRVNPAAVREDIREQNSYKSFMDPGKLAEGLSPFVSEPWNKISNVAGDDPQVLKDQLRLYSGWRNRIVHEADINPDMAGINLFSIAGEDVEGLLSFMEHLGECLCSIVRSES